MIGFCDENIKWAKDLGLTLVSVDSPSLPRDIFSTTNNVYLRLHGRSQLYEHKYTLKELSEIARKLKNAGAKAIFTFFNNNHAMLANGQSLMTMLKDT